MIRAQWVAVLLLLAFPVLCALTETAPPSSIEPRPSEWQLAWHEIDW